ncbi:MAG: amino acid permease [Chlamydiia bacterium]|nr:amino acid permease [Chlamydiia bacterium]
MQVLNFLKRPFDLYFPARGEGKAQGLGTFSGVYLPSVLQMLGVVLFMRLGWITGHAGLPKMTLIILMASSILFLTTLSMTSIVTNMKVESGGSYYIISRSLGVAFGSAIGLLLTFSQLTTIAICVSGFALSVQEILPHLSLTFLQICTLASLAIVASFPVDFALKAQTAIFCIVIASILSVLLGSSGNIPETITPLPQLEKIGFWAAFALFFPATTGIESGMSMSGDLKNPSRSLAIGSLAAVITAYIAYACLSIFMASEVSQDLLRSHPMIIYYVSKYSVLFILGVWGATLSSALGSLISSPRTLQSLAKDGVLPAALGKGYGKLGNPRVATFLIIGCATLITLLADINHLLPILSMVCLMTYGLLNFVAFFESLIQNPSWRPLFKTPLMASLAGTIACLIAMFMINPGWSFISFFALGALGFIMAKRKLKGNWNDIRYSIFSFFASTATNKLVHLAKNPRSWRPNILAIINPDLSESALIHFAHDLNQSKGFLTFGATLEDPSKIELTEASFKHYFQENNIPCFFHLNSHKISVLGTHNIVQNYGLGPLQPNTIILKAPTDRFEECADLICAAHALQKNLLLIKGLTSNRGKKEKRIDLWWGGKVHTNFELSLALSHILQSGKEWKEAQILIKTLVSGEAEKIHMTKLFNQYHAVLRFNNLSFMAYIDEKTDFYAHISEYSTDADLTFLGLRPPLPNESPKEYAEYYSMIIHQTKSLENVAYVLAGEKLNFQGILE